MEKQHKNLCMANVTCKIKGQPCPGTYGKCTCDEKEKPQECKCAYKHVNGKVVDKIPCNAHPENSWGKSYFEANLLDGDDVKDCGKAMIFAEDAWEVTEHIITQEKQKLVAEIMENLPENRKEKFIKGKKHLNLFVDGYNQAIEEVTNIIKYLQ